MQEEMNAIEDAIQKKDIDSFLGKTEIKKNVLYGRVSGKQGDEKLSLNDKVYHCKECGFEMDRDLNASINLSKYSLP